jgi:alkanesulfonate monooxygenase SsuD/methylene tetrahydromethanopterin reductase-like flavin-dependent oxidoreductase (luciferase family)
MKFGIIPINIGVRSLEQIVETARLAEELGFESVWTFEHVMAPSITSRSIPTAPPGRWVRRRRRLSSTR